MHVVLEIIVTELISILFIYIRQPEPIVARPVHIEQVAQLWQRDRAKLETISINIQRY